MAHFKALFKTKHEKAVGVVEKEFMKYFGKAPGKKSLVMPDGDKITSLSYFDPAGIFHTCYVKFKIETSPHPGYVSISSDYCGHYEKTYAGMWQKIYSELYLASFNQTK